jgi:hypothetical protein
MIPAMRGGLLVGLVVASLAAVAPAQGVTPVPPGKAGASQYFEMALGNASAGALGLVLPLTMETALVLVLAVSGRKLLTRHQRPTELGA